MSTQRNILAALLIFGIFMLIPKYLEMLGLNSSDDSLKSPAQNGGFIKDGVDKTDIEELGYNITDATQTEIQKEMIVVETDYFRAVVSNDGGGSVVSYELTEIDGEQYRYIGSYGSDGKYDENNNVVLLHDLNNQESSCSPCLVGTTSDRVVQFNQPFQRSPSNDIIDGVLRVLPGEKKKIIYKYDNIEKTLIIDGDSYSMEHKYVYDLMNIDAVEVLWEVGLFPTEPSIHPSQSYSSDELSYSSVYAYQDGDLASITQSSQVGVAETLIDEKTDWVAIRTKFFTSIMIPDQKSNYVRLSSNNLLFRGNDDILPIYSASMGGYGSRGMLNVVTFLGPLDVEYLDNLGKDKNISSIMNFGWSIIKPFSRLVLWTIKSLHNVFGLNYGVVLILIAVIMRFITAPLTRKSYESSAKMKMVAPLQKKIQEKYKNDPQRLQKEMGKLWKEHGVNPISGCLPMLIQWPILMAFFIVFRSTVEFRGAPFVLWINDLSQPDYLFSLPFEIPLYGGSVAILPILMGISMFLTMRITMQSTEGSQKTFMYFMNGFFILIFNSFPSGLTLYYTMFNFLSYQQQLSIKNKK